MISWMEHVTQKQGRVLLTLLYEYCEMIKKLGLKVLGQYVAP